MRRPALMALAIALALAPPSWAHAQDDEDEDEGSEESETSGGDEDDEDEDDEDDDDEDDDEEEASEDGEDEGEGEAGEEDEDAKDSAAAGPREWYFGPYFRYVFVPAFMLELFLEEAPTVGNVALGLAANYRGDADGPSFQIGVGFTSYAFEDPFRATGDPVTDTEWVDSDLGMIHFTGSILWNTDLAENLFFEYGIGLDLGVVTGSLVRTEARINDASNQWEPCQNAGNTGATPLVPGDTDYDFCEPGSVAYDQEGAHYGVEEERVPPVGLMPMVPHLALRFDPVEEVALKLELAYGIVQVWFGLSAAYAPKL